MNAKLPRAIVGETVTLSAGTLLYSIIVLVTMSSHVSYMSDCITPISARCKERMDKPVDLSYVSSFKLLHEGLVVLSRSPTSLIIVLAKLNFPLLV
jgi:hypothetical protein